MRRQRGAFSRLSRGLAARIRKLSGGLNYGYCGTLDAPHTSLQGNVAFSRSPRGVRYIVILSGRCGTVSAGSTQSTLPGADLAIELASESEIAAELRQTIQDYPDAGSKTVWPVYPKLRVIAVYDQSGVREVPGDRVLEAPVILPGFQAKVNQFFE